jgi:hypothetical protein
MEIDDRQESGELWCYTVFRDVFGKEPELIGSLFLKAESRREADQRQKDMLAERLMGERQSQIALLEIATFGPFPAWFVGPEYRDKWLNAAEAKAIPMPI